MRRIVLILTAVLWGVFSFAQGPMDRYLNERIENSDSSVEELKPLDERIDSFLRAWNIRGATLAVTRNDS
ncbi:MAG: hypothetical protein IK045_08230, partial [Bacteroidales bacterium]|nr:hypothetical protein [Bacteroidales bacterium]